MGDLFTFRTISVRCTVVNFFFSLIIDGLLVLDMKGPAGPWKSRMADQPVLMQEAGFTQIETGESGFSRFIGLGFALGSISGTTAASFRGDDNPTLG